jgi:hypothetical protein
MSSFGDWIGELNSLVADPLPILFLSDSTKSSSGWPTLPINETLSPRICKTIPAGQAALSSRFFLLFFQPEVDILICLVV